MFVRRLPAKCVLPNESIVSSRRQYSRPIPVFCAHVRADPRRFEGRTTTVECLAFTDHDGALWAGLGAGPVEVWTAHDGGHRATLMVHPRRTTCLLQVGSQLWAGSVDRTVAVLDAATRTPVATLDGLADMVVAMAVTPAMRVWVAAGAELTCFRADTHQRDGAAVMLPPDAAGRPVFVHALAAVGDEQLWVGTGRSLFIIDMATRSILAQFPPPPRTPTPPPASDPSVASLDLSVATDPDLV
jgi:hypothetical protein